MRLFCIRKAKHIPDDTRKTFERVGAPVVGAVLGGGLSPGPGAPEELRFVYTSYVEGKHAVDWLTEQYDRAERWETWSLIMEIAITVFIFFELLFSVLKFFWGIHDWNELRHAIPWLF